MAAISNSSSGKRSIPKMKTQKEWKEEFNFLKFTAEHMLCQMCVKFNNKLTSCKNYNPSFVNGCSNFRKSADASE